MAREVALSAGRAKELYAAVLGSAAFAWIVLWLGSRSPYARFLDHESAVGSAEIGWPGLGVFVAGWTLMVLATLVPTTTPLLVAFRRVVRRRRRRRWLQAELVAGFVGVWVAFGYFAFVADGFVHAAVDRLPWLEQRSYLIAVGALTSAGLFQFSSLKDRCLTGCRSPQSLLFQHWGGARPGREAAWVGIVHGIWCLGCCWALMLLMFAFAIGNLAWMAALGAIMAVEKHSRLGRHLTRPLGVGLLACAAVVLALGVAA